jgi:hypothetical protein
MFIIASSLLHKIAYLQSFYLEPTGQTGMCVQKPLFAILSSFILIFGLFLFLRTYACIVHLFSQERQRSCPPEVHPPNFMRGGRRVDVMSMLVRGIKKSSTSKNIQEDSA